MKSTSHSYRGFTLIELLTVIAIIALLSAILFPVFGRVRAQVRETNCISNLHEISVALKLFREDNGKFPAVMLGYAQSDSLNGGGKPNFYTGANGNPIGIDSLSYRPLTTSQRYLKDKGVFLCPDSTFNTSTAVTGAVYPVGTPLAGSPVLFQENIKENCCDDNIPIGSPAYFYLYDSYDIGPGVDRLGNPTGVTELHYSLDWTGGNGVNDPPNQLKYKDPPADKTVVTWCTYHAAVARSTKVNVLFLNGTVKPVQLPAFADKGPLGF